MAYTYSELQKDIEEIMKKYGFIGVGTIGKTLVGREIPLITIGKGAKSVLYVGTHHGMEWITSLLLMNYVRECCENVVKNKKMFGTDAEYLFENRRVFIVPMLNPDGVELQVNGRDAENPLTERLYTMSGGDFSRWQANGRGVDLNHNYNAGFAEYKAIEPTLGIFGGAPTRYSGAYPESEPEVSAMCGFIRSTDISLLIALHTQGGEIYYDYNGHVPHGAEAIARRMSAMSGYKLSRPQGAASYGGLKDWFINEFDRPGFTVECGKGVNPLPETDEPVIRSVIGGVLHSAMMFV